MADSRTRPSRGDLNRWGTEPLGCSGASYLGEDPSLQKISYPVQQLVRPAEALFVGHRLSHLDEVLDVAV